MLESKRTQRLCNPPRILTVVAPLFSLRSINNSVSNTLNSYAVKSAFYQRTALQCILHSHCAT